MTILFVHKRRTSFVHKCLLTQKSYSLSYSNNKKYKQINERIDNITREYHMAIRNDDQFLLGIAPNLCQPTNISL